MSQSIKSGAATYSFILVPFMQYRLQTVKPSIKGIEGLKFQHPSIKLQVVFYSIATLLLIIIGQYDVAFQM